LSSIKNVHPVEGGDAVRYPGEIRGRYAATHGRDGIPCDATMIRIIEEVGAEVGVPLPWELPLPA
jgi:LDH2 family malate/lactate/ureidoglycolate dehydrogenase